MTPRHFMYYVARVSTGNAGHLQATSRRSADPDVRRCRAAAAITEIAVGTAAQERAEIMPPSPRPATAPAASSSTVHGALTTPKMPLDDFNRTAIGSQERHGLELPLRARDGAFSVSPRPP